MKAISLWQSWATLWGSGKKATETRSYALRCKLPVEMAVHAAKRFDGDCKAFCRREPFRSALMELGYENVEQLPLGCVVGIVRIVRVYRFLPGVELPPFNSRDRQFGDFAYGRWGWEADQFKLLAEPIPARGGQSLWEWEPPALLKFADGGARYQPPVEASLFG